MPPGGSASESLEPAHGDRLRQGRCIAAVITATGTRLIDLERMLSYSLEGTAAQVWTLLALTPTRAEIVDQLQELYGTTARDRIDRDVEGLLRELLAAGLVDVAAGS